LLGGSTSEDSSDGDSSDSDSTSQNNNNSSDSTDSDLEECAELQNAIRAWLQGTYIHCLVV
jgi:hypothetical protein